MTLKSENISILIVDDTPDNLELVDQILSEIYQTITAENGEQCIEIAKVRQPDLILLDVMMPKMNGYEVLEALLDDESTKNIPVIFLTARYKDTDRITRGLQSGAIDYITKPLDDEILLARVGVALRVKHAEDQLRKKTDLLESQVEELNQAKRTNQEAHEELEFKNEELESFSYSVSHDLKAPLRSIQGFSQMLSEEYANQLDEQGNNYLNRILNSVHKMDMLISDLLQLSRMTRMEMNFQPLSLSQLVIDISNNLVESYPEYPRKIIIEEGINIKADAILMRSVIENLLDNAWKYTSKIGNPIIEFGEIKEQNKDRVFYVKDNGVGFDLNFSGKLFGAFQRMHNVKEYPGTGIGLATVQRIIRRHGGKVWADAELNRGATFYFSLP